MTKNNAVLIFADGEVIYGLGIGKKHNDNQMSVGEICFNTSITGYQEILTDPSYSGQIINFTFPHIGNVGVNDFDIEGSKPKAQGLIIRENITNPSSYRSSQHFNDWLITNKITGICGVDTRAITHKIKSQGAKNVAIIYNEDISKVDIIKVAQELSKVTDLTGVELASEASLNLHYQWQNQGRWQQKDNIYNQPKNKKFRVVAIDYGSKLNILRCLTEVGCEVFVVPAQASFAEIKKYQPDGVFLSNGPGDPAQTAKYSSKIIKEIIDSNIPLFGICLGHQLLALAMGAKTIKMAQGHRGANHPVQDLATKKVEITSQNHGFCVEEATLPSCLEISHISLFDRTIEGFVVKGKPAFSVQYHPESSPGPSDSYYLFQKFIDLMAK